MNRRAYVFSISMVFVSIMALTYSYIVVSGKIDRLPDYVVGERQFSMIRAYQDAYDAFLAIDSSARDSAEEAIISLASNGGMSNPSLIDDESGFYGSGDCGSFMGYPLWNTAEKDIEECFPEVIVEYNQEFNAKMKETLWKKGMGASSYNLAIEEKSYSLIRGKTTGILSFDRSVRPVEKIGVPETIIKDLSETLVPAESVTSYYSCNALYTFKDKTENNVKCTYTTTGEFSGFVSFKSPYLVFLANENGNAVRSSFGEDVVGLAESWNSAEGGKSALGLYSVSTGVHSCTSKHNTGQAADISGCYDRDGNYHDSKNADEVFQRCEQHVMNFWRYKGTFISYRNCIVASGDTCASKDSLIKTHYNHIHIQEG